MPEYPEDIIIKERDIITDWIGAEAYLKQNLNTIFYGRLRNLAGATSKAIIDRHWGINEMPASALILPAEYDILSFYSRQSFKYGYLSVKCKLPPPVAEATFQTCFMGFEAQGSTRLGSAAFYYDSLSDLLKIFVGGGTSAGFYDISSLLPDNPTTTEHVYTVKMDRDIQWYFINGIIVAIVLINQPENLATVNPPPYGMITHGASNFCPSTMSTLVEIVCDKPVTWEISQYTAVNGEEKPARRLNMYQSETTTKFDGLTVVEGEPGAGEVQTLATSHPFPVFGYAGKTIRFKADKASAADGLVIEELLMSGSWRTYEAQTYTINDDWIYAIAADSVMMRLKYTPSAYPATIFEGEVVIR